MEHYHQAVAVVVAQTFEQARAAARLVRVEYAREKGAFNLADDRDAGTMPNAVQGDFAGAFDAAPVKLDETYTTPDQAHCMMEPHATVAAW